MGKPTTKTSDEVVKPKRTVLTAEQRIERIKAELAAAEAKAQAKAEKQAKQAKEKLAGLVAKRDKLNEQIAAAEAAIAKVETTDTKATV